METRTLHCILAIGLGLSLVSADFSTNCPLQCKCGWTTGSKQADCSHSNFHDIPESLSSEIQILNLSNNELKEIKKNAFEIVQLINLKKLILKECNITMIHENGLRRLSILIELNLSKNNLKTLDMDMFKETPNIRWINLNDNQIEKLDDGLFKNLMNLQKVDLSYNQIIKLGLKTFMNVPRLNTLKLDGNKLKRLNTETLSTLPSISYLDLHDNPWICDCYLQPLVNWVTSNHLNTLPIACSEPAKVFGKLWHELDSNDFSCGRIINNSTETTLHSKENNISLSCQVNGVLSSDNGEIINGTYEAEVKYVDAQSNSEKSKWLNLTIVDFDSSENKEYICVPKKADGQK